MVISQVQAVGFANAERAVVRVDGLSIDDNDVRAAGTAIGIAALQMFASGNGGDAEVAIGTISIDRNTLVSDAPGILIMDFSSVLSSDRETSSSRIDLISLSENTIKTNNSGIRLQYLELGASSNGSAEVALGGLHIIDNAITSLREGISLNMMVGDLYEGASAKVAEVIVEGNGISVLEGSGIWAVLGMYLYDESSLAIGEFMITDNGIHGSNYSALGLAMNIGNHNASTIDMSGVQILHNNITGSRLGLNLTGVKGATAYLNNFIGNIQDSLLNTSTVSWISPEKIWYKHGFSNFSNYVGNYWDRYTGADVDDDGLGDTPYDTGYDLDTHPFTSNVDEHFPPWHDVTPPSIWIVSPADGSFLSTTDVVVEWTGDDDLMGIMSYSVRLDGGGWIDKGLLTQYTLSDIAEGTHTFEVMAFDRALNWNQTATTFMIDVTDPEITMITPSEGEYLSSGDIIAEWSGNDGGSGIEGYEFTYDGGASIDKELNTTQPLTGLEEGSHAILLIAHDRAGNHRMISVSFFVDTVHPMISPEAPVDGGYYNTSDLNARWTVMDLNPVRAIVMMDDGAEIDVGTANEYIFTGLSEGVHTLSVSVADLSLNEATFRVTFTIDTLIPNATFMSPGGYVNTSDISVALLADGTGSPLGDLYASFDGGGRVLMDSVNYSGGVLRFTLSGYTDGDHTISLELYDVAGNVVRLSSLFAVDTVFPTVVQVSPMGNDVRTDRSISATFSERMRTDEVVMTIGTVGAISWQGNALTFDPDGLLDPGRTYTVTVTGPDQAGNVVRYTWQFTTATKGTIIGSVLDEDGNPVVGAVVRLDTGESVLTGADGTFSIEALQGKRTVTVMLGDDELTMFQVDVVAGAETDAGDHSVKLPSEEGKGFPWWALIIVALVLLALLIVLIAIFVFATRKKITEDVWEE
jgi:hypothetical protein